MDQVGCRICGMEDQGMHVARSKGGRVHVGICEVCWGMRSAEYRKEVVADIDWMYDAVKERAGK